MSPEAFVTLVSGRTLRIRMLPGAMSGPPAEDEVGFRRFIDDNRDGAHTISVRVRRAEALRLRPRRSEKDALAVVAAGLYAPRVRTTP
jgi:hypothetical protein